MSNAALARYNFRVVMFNHWWLLVFPIAISQLTVFWSLITLKFSPALPAVSVEQVTPLLAAFLSAHILSAEYPSRVGAILASKPLHIGKVVLMRLGAILLLAWALELLSLAAFYFGMAPYDIATTFAASIPSTLFLALLAVTFATLLRHPLAGFGVATLYWALDLTGNAPINPFLSLRSYSTALASAGPMLDGLVRPWWIAKLLLVVGALVLYRIHARLVFRLGVPVTLRKRRATLGWAGLLLLIYVVTGACVKVGWGYANRGGLAPNDPAWFRREFASFGPLPVVYLFGPNFRHYLGDVSGSWLSQHEGETEPLGDTLQHRQELREVLKQAPDSLWAPSAAELLARLTSREQASVENRVSVLQRVVDSYPTSPYVDYALHEKAIMFDNLDRRAEAGAVYEELLRRRPNSIHRSEAVRYLMENARTAGDLAGAEKWAREWMKVALLYERPTACITLAELLQKRGDMSGAKQAAQQTLQAVERFQQVMQNDPLAFTPSQQAKWEQAVVEAKTKALRY